MEIRIYLTNLAKYNQGTLIGKWLELPLTDEELEIEIRSRGELHQIKTCPS